MTDSSSGSTDLHAWECGVNLLIDRRAPSLECLVTTPRPSSVGVMSIELVSRATFSDGFERGGNWREICARAPSRARPNRSYEGCETMQGVLERHMGFRNARGRKSLALWSPFGLGYKSALLASGLCYQALPQPPFPQPGANSIHKRLPCVKGFRCRLTQGSESLKSHSRSQQRCYKW